MQPAIMRLSCNLSRKDNNKGTAQADAAEDAVGAAASAADDNRFKAQQTSKNQQQV